MTPDLELDLLGFAVAFYACSCAHYQPPPVPQFPYSLPHALSQRADMQPQKGRAIERTGSILPPADLDEFFDILYLLRHFVGSLLVEGEWTIVSLAQN